MRVREIFENTKELGKMKFWGQVCRETERRKEEGLLSFSKQQISDF